MRMWNSLTNDGERRRIVLHVSKACSWKDNESVSLISLSALFFFFYYILFQDCGKFRVILDFPFSSVLTTLTSPLLLPLLTRAALTLLKGLSQACCGLDFLSFPNMNLFPPQNIKKCKQLLRTGRYYLINLIHLWALFPVVLWKITSDISHSALNTDTLLVLSCSNKMANCFVACMLYNRCLKRPLEGKIRLTYIQPVVRAKATSSKY